MVMAKRGYATITASAHDSMSKLRRFVQKNRSRREPHSFVSGSYDEARDEIVEISLNGSEPEERAIDDG